MSARVHGHGAASTETCAPVTSATGIPASDLTVDHVVPLAAGGAPLDIANCAVLCRSCNSTKGASEPVSVASVGLTGHRGGRRPGWGIPCADTHAPRPRLPYVRTRPSFAKNPGRDAVLRPDPGRREARYRLGMSPGYRRSTRSSSCSVSPRPASRCDCSSAPAMKAIRSRRLSSLNRSELLVGRCDCWFTPAFSPFVALATRVLPRSSAEPNGDPPLAKVDRKAHV